MLSLLYAFVLTTAAAFDQGTLPSSGMPVAQLPKTCIDTTYAPGTGGQPVPDSTHSQPHAIRKTPILCALQGIGEDATFTENANQLILFDF